MELSRRNTEPPPCPQIRYGKIESTLARKPKFGVYPRWPVDGTDWIHPNDVELARKLIPSQRIFLRIDLDDEYLLLGYGDHSVRVHPTLWVEVPEPAYEIGDEVEIKSKMGKVRPQIAMVSAVFWNHPDQVAEFHLQRLGKPMAKVFRADDLRPTVRLGEFMPVRHLGKTELLP